MANSSNVDRLVDLLKDFGWSEPEANCYCTLVRLGEGKASTIATEIGIRNEKVYQHLNRLVENGYVKTRGKNPKVYMAQNPRYVINKETEKMQDKSRELLKGLEEAWEIQEELTRAGDNAWILGGRDGKNMELNNLIENAENSVIGFDKGIVRTTRRVRELMEERAKKLDMKLIGGSQSTELLERFREAGIETRKMSGAAKSAFYVADDMHVLLNISAGRSTIVLEDEEIAKVFIDKFKSLFKKANKLGENAG
ncbi:hypothetical protein AKJ36_00115 [candidate division MSBL1 archaeon SCGC-AAA259I07]|uniref:Transcription regulator TrmB N-terminal domain-containing protein n=1 Tax=candidate division MSBL1 archaeon SCGC-AAA259I07 TaxID=1698266 RepID=A0A133UN50_9EURY|nr:hypothetical protein AKJ36_00115 [candidate division MSBL1 archaeon SCGC-AAA259I07]